MSHENLLNDVRDALLQAMHWDELGGEPIFEKALTRLDAFLADVPIDLHDAVTCELPSIAGPQTKALLIMHEYPEIERKAAALLHAATTKGTSHE